MLRINRKFYDKDGEAGGQTDPENKEAGGQTDDDPVDKSGDKVAYSTYKRTVGENKSLKNKLIGRNPLF